MEMDSNGRRHARRLVRQARQASATGQPLRAIALFHQAIRIAPLSRPGWYRDLSICYAGINRWRQACKYLQQSRKLAGHRFKHWHLLLSFLYKRQDWTALEQIARKTRARTPHDPQVYYYLGAAKFGRGQKAKARANLLYGLKIDRDRIRADFRLLRLSAERFPDRHRMLHFISNNLAEIKDRAAQIPVQPELYSKKVFQYWAQGFDNAPPIVQICHRQIILIHGIENVVSLDDEKFKSLLTLPAYITDNPKILRAHRSDAIRMLLLAQFGGIWADATCFCTVDIRKHFAQYLKNGFFAYRRSQLRMANWFLCGSPGSVISTTMAAALLQYWKTHSETRDYFIFQHMFEALALLDDQFAEEWSRAKIVDRSPSLSIARSFHKQYEQAKLEKMLNEAAIHKLTYKEHKYRRNARPVEQSIINFILTNWTKKNEVIWPTPGFADASGDLLR